eukprot:SAG31_NODE_39445_length_288_cov_0.814815_1_plen_42_part_10
MRDGRWWPDLFPASPINASKILVAESGHLVSRPRDDIVLADS